MFRTRYERVTILVIAVLALSTIAFAEPPQAAIEQYGELHILQDGVTIPEFVVTIGEPRFSPDRGPLAVLTGTYLANAVFWVQKADRNGWWIRSEYYRVPRTPEDFTSMRDKGIAAFKLESETTSRDLPEPIHNLGPVLLKNISGVLAFYSGAFRIYLDDQSEEAATLLMNAINAPKQPL